MENVHSETYSLLLEAYVRDPARRRHLFGAIDSVPSVKVRDFPVSTVERGSPVSPGRDY